MVWESFWELSTDRPSGFGVGPIPHRAIRDYANDERIEGEAFERFLRLIRGMDSKYLEYHEKHRGKDKGVKHGDS